MDDGDLEVAVTIADKIGLVYIGYVALCYLVIPGAVVVVQSIRGKRS